MTPHREACRTGAASPGPWLGEFRTVHVERVATASVLVIAYLRQRLEHGIDANWTPGAVVAETRLRVRSR